jgi:hypothetical protein
VAAVQKSDLVVVVLGQDGGDELLPRQRAVQRGLDAGDDVGQVGLVIGRLAERADHRGGRFHRFEALAPNVADRMRTPAGLLTTS